MYRLATVFGVKAVHPPHRVCRLRPKYQIYLSIFERENSNLFAWLVQELRDIVSKVIILSERAKSIHLFLF